MSESNRSGLVSKDKYSVTIDKLTGANIVTLNDPTVSVTDVRSVVKGPGQVELIWSNRSARMREMDLWP
jgi:hypothetical protein